MVALGIGIQPALEMGHHQHPAGEREQRRATGGGQAGSERLEVPLADFGDHPEPLDVSDQPPEQHRDALGRERMHAAQEPGEIPIDLDVVERVAELVQHRAGPVLGRAIVAEDAHVAFVVDVDAERVLALPVAGEQVAALQDGADVEAETVVGPHGERVEVALFEPRVEVHRSGSRRLLEEGVVVVPGTERIDGAVEPLRETGIELGLPRGERRRGRPIDLVERGEEPRLVQLARLEREREVVARSEMARRTVAEPGLLLHPLRHLGTHLLRRFPGSAPFAGVVAGAQDPGNRVVVDLLAVDPAAEGVERAVDLGIELDLLRPQVGRDLLRERAVVQHLELTALEAVAVLRRGAARGERVAHLGEGRHVAERVAQRHIRYDPAPLTRVRTPRCSPATRPGWPRSRAAGAARSARR